MPFNRRFDDRFIDTLNSLYEQDNSWWRRIADDPDVFIAVRDNSINAYAGGGSIARIERSGRLLRLLVHPKYLVFADVDEDTRYCNLLGGKPPLAVIVKSDEDYCLRFARIKHAAKFLAGQERRDENLIARRSHHVIDIEAEFDTTVDSKDPEVDSGLSQQGRMDFVVIDETGRLGVVELKLWSNKEIQPRGNLPPAVCGQLAEYYQWLSSHKDQVLVAYQRTAAVFGKLKGRFFELRRGFTPTALDCVPRLLIVGHTRREIESLRHLRQTIVDSLQNVIPGFDRQRVQAVGNARSVTQDRHLLLS